MKLFNISHIVLICKLLAIHGLFGNTYIKSQYRYHNAIQLYLSIDQPIRRNDFPILSTMAHPGKPLVYLDSAASSQKPNYVLEAMDDYYRTSHANVHRGAHALAVKATEKYEWSRDQVKIFVNAKQREEIIFTKGATDALNLVVMSYGQRLQPGDEVILSVSEHHSNIVPWQILAEKTGIVLKFVQLTSDMTFDIEHYLSLLSSKTKIVSIQHASNVLGTVNPVKEIIFHAHEKNAIVILDACQSVPHMKVDVQELDVDFLVASSHKMCGPTGIGFLYGKLDLLKSMPPVNGGGEMIDLVTLEKTTFAQPPSRFEAGTPAIAEAYGLGKACEYLMSIGIETIHEHEVQLGKYLYDRLQSIDGLALYGPKPSDTQRTGLVAFNHKTIHPTDLAFFLDQEGIAVRSGHHCTQPLHKILNIAGSIRVSTYFYNSKEDVDVFISSLLSTIQMFQSINM